MSNIAVLLSFSCTVTVLGADDLRLFLIWEEMRVPVAHVRSSALLIRKSLRIPVNHGSGNCIGARVSFCVIAV